MSYTYSGKYTLHSLLFFINDTATTEIYTLSLHDALPISPRAKRRCPTTWPTPSAAPPLPARPGARQPRAGRDRKSTRLNSSHMSISYAVFCLKKKKKKQQQQIEQLAPQ